MAEVEGPPRASDSTRVARSGTSEAPPNAPTPQESRGSAPGACDTGALPFRRPSELVGQLVRTIRVLTIRDLSVEIGGTTIVEGVTTRGRPGREDRALVGRNGAGKTTLLRVLGGVAAPRSGTVRRPQAAGYLSQDPRADAVPDDTICMAHVLSGAGSRPARRTTREGARRGRGGPVDRRTSTASPSSRSASRPRAATRRSRRSAGSPPASGSPTTASTSPRALSGGERRRLELVRILFAGSELLLLDEPTNHLDADAVRGCCACCAHTAAHSSVVSHDLDLLDDAITRVVHVDREPEGATGAHVRVQGHVLAVPRRRAKRRGAAAADDGEAAAARRSRRLSTLATDAGPDREAGARRPQRSTAVSPGSRPSASEAPEATAAWRCVSRRRRRARARC